VTGDWPYDAFEFTIFGLTATLFIVRPRHCLFHFAAMGSKRARLAELNLWRPFRCAPVDTQGQPDSWYQFDLGEQ
jgi:hypothetical protein